MFFIGSDWEIINNNQNVRWVNVCKISFVNYTESQTQSTPTIPQNVKRSLRQSLWFTRDQWKQCSVWNQVVPTREGVRALLEAEIWWQGHLHLPEHPMAECNIILKLGIKFSPFLLSYPSWMIGMLFSNVEHFHKGSPSLGDVFGDGKFGHCWFKLFCHPFIQETFGEPFLGVQIGSRFWGNSRRYDIAHILMSQYASSDCLT